MTTNTKKDLYILQQNKKLYESTKIGTKGKMLNLKKKHYVTHFNGGRPFLVIVFNNRVDVYSDTYRDEVRTKEIDHLWKYNKTFHYKKLFIGTSKKIPMTLFSRGYGKYFDGNTILLQLTSNASKYVIISDKIYYTTIKNDEIIKYYSPVGNNDVPYNYAIGNTHYYFFFEKLMIPTEHFNGIPVKDIVDRLYENIKMFRHMKNTQLKLKTN